MTLDEAIKRAEEVADTKLQYAELSEIQGCYNNAKKCYANATEYRKLAEWLKELKTHREAWVKVLDEMMNVSIPGQDAEYVYQNIYDIIKKYRPSLAILANKSEAKE